MKLPEDCVPSAWVGPEDSSWTINARGSPILLISTSISPDLRHFAFSNGLVLFVYSASTGEFLWQEMAGGPPWFSPNGRDVWCGGGGEVRVLRVSDGREVLEPPAGVDNPPEGYPWRSSRGCRVTEDWWILGPDGKRLLLLPPPWQSHARYRVWKGQFLALLHCGLPEPVILELEIDPGL